MLVTKRPKKAPRVAIVHDWLIGGGAELVVEQLHQMYPEAPIYTSYATREWRKRLDGKVRTGWLQPLGKIRKFIPLLRIIWFTNLKFTNYDLVISTSGAEAKGIKVPNNTIHVNYCHAPTHYYWSRYDDYMRRPGFPRGLNWIARVGLFILVRPLRRWDFMAAQRPDYMIANSKHIKAEIEKYYDRDSTVINPPVYIKRFQKPANQRLPRKNFLITGRQTPYKHFDLAVKACTKLDLPLVVIGDGPDNARLRRLAGPTITFLGRAPDKVVEEEFGRAWALLFPGLDDFGITPVEAMAAGTPVIAFKGGGALDYVIPGRSGEFFDALNTKSLATVLQKFNPKRYSAPAIANFASTRFSQEKFQRSMTSYVQKLLK